MTIEQRLKLLLGDLIFQLQVAQTEIETLRQEIEKLKPVEPKPEAD